MQYAQMETDDIWHILTATHVNFILRYIMDKKKK